MNNYDKMEAQARGLFLKWDQDALVRRNGLEADAEFLYINYLGLRHRIARATGVVEACADAGWLPAGFNASLAIFDYICRDNFRPGLSGRYSPVHALAHTGQTSPSAVDFHQRYADRFQECMPLLRDALKPFDCAPFPTGDVACVLHVFDNMPVIFQFWEGDEEFPPSVRFLWDENTLSYLFFETTYYIMGDFLRRVGENIENLSRQNDASML